MPQEQIQNQLNQPSQSPNLFKNRTGSYSDAQLSRYKKIKTIEEYALVIIELILICLIGFALKQNSDIKKVDAQLADTLPQIRELKEIRSDAIDLYYRKEKIKELQAQTFSLHKNIDLIYTATPQRVVIRGLDAQDMEIKLNMETPSPQEFTKLIINYLQDKRVQQITLNSAQYQVAEDIYSFAITVNFNEQTQEGQ